MKYIITIISIAISTFSFAQSLLNVADTQSFGVKLFLVPDAIAFEEMWAKPETPRLTVFNKVSINTQFSAVILYWGGGSGSDKNCNIHLKTTVLAGSEVKATGTSMPVCENHAPPAPGILALGETIIDVVASGEPSSLTVKVEVTDNINHETLVVFAPIEVVEE